MVERIRALEWSKTALGPIDGWQQSLRTAVNILLSSRYAMWMAWGKQLSFLYNDAYRPTLGIKHPRALGNPANEVWAEIWSDIGPLVETVMKTGRATYHEGLLLFLERSGFPEETYHTFSYSPLADDRGEIAGMLCVVTEETDRFIGERRAETLRDIGSALAVTNTEDEVLQTLSSHMSLNKKDLPFALIYLFDDKPTPDDPPGATLAASSGIERGDPLAPERIEPHFDSPWPASQIFRQPSLIVIEDLSEQRKRGPLPAGDWNKPVERAVAVPIKQQGLDQPAGFLIVGTNPYRRYDTAYGGFVDLLAGQIAAALGNARAHEAERQRAEALAELDRAKTTFFSNVSHELRTPLTLLLSPIEELLADARQKNPRELELLEFVHRNSLRLQKLVNALLDFSRIEAGRMRAVYEPVELDRLTEDLASNFGSAMDSAGLNFRVQCEVLTEPVYVDRAMWEKIVLNLISNALKFTLQGAVTVSVKQKEGRAEFAVHDTGIGIPEHEIPHIFERFHRVENAQGRSIEGTGIGLALVQELVKLHGGSISVLSTPNVGSSFTISIPLGIAHLPKNMVRLDGEQETTALRADTFTEEALRWIPSPENPGESVEGHDHAPGARRRKILVADDNADMRDYLTRLLRDHYTVIAARDGAEALLIAASDSPDLILSDVMMPGITGFELVTALRKSAETSTIPVILLSARAGEESRVEGLTGGADDYLIKPFTARELFARIGAHLSMRDKRQAAEAALRESQQTLRHSNEELRRANADLEQFAYSASHDLQEPLRQVSVYSELLEKRFADKLDGKGLEYLRFCVEGARRMEMLIGDLLAYTQAAKSADAVPLLLDSNKILAEVEKNLATAIAESGATISASSLPLLRGNPVPLTHLFQNLISNALKYRSEQPPRVEVSAIREGKGWLFSIRDNGIGIPEEFHEQIFGIFKRLHNKKTYPGTGIGLAICQKVVERYGGRIWVESAAGKGATFFFTLPAAEAHEISPLTSPTAAP